MCFFFFFFFSSLPSYIFSSYNSQSMSISTSVHVHRMIVLKVERELERSHLFSSPLVVFFYLRMKCLSDHFSIIVEIDLTLTVRHSNNEEILSLLRWSSNERELVMTSGDYFYPIRRANLFRFNDLICLIIKRKINNSVWEREKNTWLFFLPLSFSLYFWRSLKIL